VPSYSECTVEMNGGFVIIYLINVEEFE
jgi:hypothetical protein